MFGIKIASFLSNTTWIKIQAKTWNMSFKSKPNQTTSLSFSILPLSPASQTTGNNCPEAAVDDLYFIFSPFHHFARESLWVCMQESYSQTWQVPHNHLWLMLRTPNPISFHDVHRIISDLGCITCQKHFNLPWIRAYTSMLVSEKQLVIFFTACPKYSFFYLPHNVEMKEAKSVCPLESIVTTAITQVIWLKLRHPAWFFYALTSRQQKMERVAHKKAKCSKGTSWKLPIRCGLFQRPFQSIGNSTRDKNLQCHLLIQNVFMFLVCGCFSHSRSWWLAG